MAGLKPPLAVAAALVFAGGGLSACGFTPLYATPGVTPALEAVQVQAPQTRAGFMLHEKIDDEFARNLDMPTRYRLTLTVDEKRFARGLRVNNVASDEELDLRVNYVLTENATGKVMTRGFIPVSVFYASANAPYAGIATQEDAQSRAADQAAIQIRLDLSRFFAAQSAKGELPQ